MRRKEKVRDRSGSFEQEENTLHTNRLVQFSDD